MIIANLKKNFNDRKFSKTTAKFNKIQWGVCIPLRGNIPLGVNICYKWMKIEKISFKSIEI